MIVSSEELLANGYTEIVLKTEEGTLEFFVMRLDYSGWSLDTTGGCVLEFVGSV